MRRSHATEMIPCFLALPCLGNQGIHPVAFRDILERL
jgi:hypothetical protein